MHLEDFFSTWLVVSRNEARSMECEALEVGEKSFNQSEKTLRWKLDHFFLGWNSWRKVLVVCGEEEKESDLPGDS